MNYFEEEGDYFNICDHCFWFHRVKDDQPPCIFCEHLDDKIPPESYDYQKQLKLYKNKLKDKRR